MKKCYLWLVIAALMILSTACEPTSTAEVTMEFTEVLVPPTITVAPPTEISLPPPPLEPVLTINGLDGATVALTMEELVTLPATEGYGGIKSSTGRITPPALYRGVALSD